MNFLIRWLACALATGVAVWLVPGVDIVGAVEAWVALVVFGLVLSLVNISIKPVLQVLSLPVTVLTLGLFYLVVNTLLLYVASWLSMSIFGIGIYLQSFASAFIASIVISIVSVLVNSLVKD